MPIVAVALGSILSIAGGASATAPSATDTFADSRALAGTPAPDQVLALQCDVQPLQACDAGTYPCGDAYCTPDGGVCCASVGNPQAYCPGGTACCADGTCSPNGTCGGDGCGAGTYECGGTSCTPDGGVCCASVGRPESYCPGGTTCCADGTCSPNGVCGELPGSTGGPSEDGLICSSAPVAECGVVETCLQDSDPCIGFYRTDGTKFPFNACEETSLQAAADKVAEYCVGGGGGGGGSSDDSDSDDSGCTVHPHARWPGMSALFIIGFALLGRRRRCTRTASRRDTTRTAGGN